MPGPEDTKQECLERALARNAAAKAQFAKIKQQKHWIDEQVRLHVNNSIVALRAAHAASTCRLVVPLHAEPVRLRLCASIVCTCSDQPDVHHKRRCHTHAAAPH